MRLNEENLKLIFGLKLRSFRQAKKFSLKEFSKLSGLSPSYINEIEKGKKYPKADKIVQLANTLEVEYDELISSKLTKELHPVNKILQSELLQEIPFDLFGFKSTDLMELMSNAPTKFSAFLSTLIEIARNYDLSKENFFFAALRSYQEMHNNYFPEIEEKVSDFQKNNLVDFSNLENLKDFLTTEYGINIDEKRLSKEDDFSKIRSVFVNSKTLLINENLIDAQKKFILAKEIGYRVLNLSLRSSTSNWIKSDSFEHVLNNFQAGYFAGSLLLPEHKLVKDIKDFFKQKKWSSDRFLELKEKYAVTPETFLTRLTQLIPAHFGLDQLFFLRYFHHIDRDKFEITKELHFSKLHSPHGVGLDEHYCRRWITISLLNDVKTAQHLNENPIIAGTQKSQFSDTENEYFCISMARPLTLDNNINSCLTIGFQITDEFKKSVKFSSDSSIIKKTVNETCERCGILDCDDRVAKPQIFESEKKNKQQIKLLRKLISELN